jgi:hypothetical protein
MKIKKTHSLIYGNFFELLSKPNYQNTFFGNEKEINSKNFRSNEFIKDHKSKHILFSGCSVTSGVGLLEEEIWSKKVYNKILEKEECSGYFNIAISATGVCDQVSNMFKYFNIYGNPDVIFFMMPDNGRFYAYDKEFKKVRNAFVEDEDRNLILFLYKQYYMMLESYCKTNNIDLFSFTYINELQENFKKYFKTFYEIDKNKMIDFVFDYIENNKKNQYLEKARDNEHFGIAYHEYWSNFIYEIYKKNKKKN